MKREMMNERRCTNWGSALLITVFTIALLSVLVMGILQMNTEETQLMQNQICAAQALAVAEAGLNDAFAQIRTNKDWSSGFSNKPFEGGSYTVTVTGTIPNRTIESTGTTSRDFVARVKADITISSSSPYIIRIDSLRINE
jgi:Tfp pilus assembly protein PilX